MLLSLALAVWGSYATPLMPVRIEAIQIVEIKTPKQIVIETAKKYGVPVNEALFFVEHEGGWQQEPCVQSEYVDKKGNRENSWGSFQINLDWNPQITKEQACNIVWASNWAMKQLAEGKSYLWTSSRNQN